MYRPPRRTIATALAVQHPILASATLHHSRSKVVPLRKNPAAAVQVYGRRTEESEALLAALSMAAIFLIILVSVVMKLWLG